VPVPKSLAKTDEECGDLMDAHPALNDVVRAMRHFRRCNTLLKKANTFDDMVCDGVLPLNMFYCGAPHTRRWSSKAPNVQNLDKEPVIISGDWTPDQVTNAISKGEPIPAEVRYVWSRAWIVPSPGKTFLVLDFSQIEPRCLNWLAGNTAMIEAMNHGFSYYEAYAHAAKNWRGQPGTLKKEFGITRYTKLKNEALGCGYGMGAAKYTTYANVTPEEAAQIVADFRRTNPKVTALWRRLDEVIKQAARVRGDNNFAITMPTGDVLKHFDIKATGSGFKSTTVRGEYTQGTIQHRLWGGVLTENIVQRMARDVLAEAVVRLEAAGLPVMWHAHDEVILELDDDLSKEDAKSQAVQIMRTPPAWAEGLPLDVEGGFTSHYCK
jgi:DNA polymerase